MTVRSQDEIWFDDKLNRRADAEFLETFLCKRMDELRQLGSKRAFVLNIDAEWGQGKTFFLRRFKEQLQNHGHVAVYVNAWEDDFANDPLLPVMAAIDSGVSSLLPKKSRAASTWKVTKNTATSMAKIAAVGLGKRALASLITKASVEAAEAVWAQVRDLEIVSQNSLLTGGAAAGEDISAAATRVIDLHAEPSVTEFQHDQAVVMQFKNNLAKFVKNLQAYRKNQEPLFIFIDELDRCRPPFALALLERIKHLFATSSVVFVLATDTKQLEASVCAIYGGAFDGRRYFKRFFDRTYMFDRAPVGAFVDHLLQVAPLDEQKIAEPPQMSTRDFMVEYYHRRNIELRGIEQMHDILRTIVTVWSARGKLDVIFLLPMIESYYRDPSLVDDPRNLESGSFVMGLEGWFVNSRDRRTGIEDRRSMQQIISYAWSKLGQGDLRRYLQEDQPSDSINRWIFHRADDEYNAIYNGLSRSRPAEGSPGRARSYPSLIRQAGRITEIYP